jgi:DNA processing protein
MNTTVISGLAAGIDREAHLSALERGGRTVAVIGTGIDKCYPAANADIQRKIEEFGLVLSQFWPGAPPTRHSFPLRNATMSAYGEATVIVQAGETSGARIQARQAVEHGRPLVLMRRVVEQTKWGDRLASAAGDVVVADTADDAVEHVEQILSRHEGLRQLQASLG